MAAEITFGVGALLIVLSVAAFRGTRKFLTKCVTTDGTIVAYTTEESEEGVYYYSVMRFIDANGESHDIGGPHGLQSPPEVGTAVSITYDPASPTNAWIAGTASPWVIPWLLMLAGLAFVIGGFVVRAEGG